MQRRHHGPCRSFSYAPPTLPTTNPFSPHPLHTPQSELPVTVKIRTGESEKKVNVERVAALLARTGAAGLIVHGRTMEQRWVGAWGGVVWLPCIGLGVRAATWEAPWASQQCMRLWSQ